MGPLDGGRATAHHGLDGEDLSGRRARRVGPYRLLELIGEGAMGQVFRAEHETLRRPVALKILRRELAREPSCVQRFFAEARAVNLIRCEHIVEVTDLFRESSGQTCLVMELLDGQDLATLQGATPLRLARALELVRQLADTLTRVHRAGIVHRDLKPENVFVVRREGRDFVKLLDFGIAKLTELTDAQLVARTSPGLVLGTPQYMAPEQATADHVDYRSDIYALGVILFELVTGRLPFDGRTLRELFVNLAVNPPPLASECVELPRSVHREMDDLLARCLQKDPARRPQSAAEVQADLEGMIGALEGEPEVADIAPRENQRASRHTTALAPTRQVTAPAARPRRRPWLHPPPAWLVASAAVGAALLVGSLRSQQSSALGSQAAPIAGAQASSDAPEGTGRSPVAMSQAQSKADSHPTSPEVDAAPPAQDEAARTAGEVPQTQDDAVLAQDEAAASRETDSGPRTEDESPRERPEEAERQTSTRHGRTRGASPARGSARPRHSAARANEKDMADRAVSPQRALVAGESESGLRRDAVLNPFVD